jgi:cell pole-organizing protein PopZ
MEEILASIRRIIADDDANKTAQREAEAPKPAPRAEAAPEPLPPAPPPVAAPEPRVAEMIAEPPPPAAAPARIEAIADQGSYILDLTESMTAPMPEPALSVASEPAAQFRKIDGHSDLSFDDPIEEPAMQNAAAEVRSHYIPDSRESAGRDEDERGRLLSRATSAAVDSAFNSLAQTVLVQNARTLEDLVREMLRPMLKSWLDDNLPGVVERLVRAEIERVSRGRMG